MMPRMALVVLMLLSPTVEASGERLFTYDAVVAGMKCQQNSVASMECDYRVGRSLHFNIAGVGQKDASITFFQVSWDGDYYASVGVQHGCVVVKPGKAVEGPRVFDFAFVSPQTGKVYSTWQTCQQAQ
jgi:hypothetical protein